jgi:hypothetical protein
MGYDPKGMITRRHFLGYKAGCAGAPPPLHVVAVHPPANHYPLPRPVWAGRAEPGPALVLGGAAEPSLGIDPTDPSTWGGRGYRQCTGMIGRFNQQDDWQGFVPPGGQGVRPSCGGQGVRPS